MNIWEQFDKQIDIEGLKNDVKDAANNTGGGSFEEVPVGTYEVAVEKMELKASKKGSPMLSIWFKVVAGKRKGALIFYNQVLTTGFGIHNANEFMKSLDSNVKVEFDNFTQYKNTILDVFEEVNGSLTYELEYGKNAKGFNTYTIKNVFEN